MLIQLRNRCEPDRHAEHDPTAMLLACHQRIRDHLELAQRLVDAHTASAGEVVEVATRLTRYFGRALPLHIEDEDQFLTAALSQAELPGRHALAVMSEEHLVIEPVVQSAVLLFKNLVANPSLLSDTREALQALRLATLLLPHLELEERVIFPLIRTHLSTDGQAALAQVMHDRRRHEKP